MLANLGWVASLGKAKENSQIKLVWQQVCLVSSLKLTRLPNDQLEQEP